jgi:hypothetical protein
MTEPSSAEAEAPIVHIGVSLSPDQNTDASEVVVDENDRLVDFNPCHHEAWPDERREGGTFELDAFPPLDEGAK